MGKNLEVNRKLKKIMEDFSDLEVKRDEVFKITSNSRAGQKIEEK